MSDDLRKLAESATPGPWRPEEFGDEFGFGQPAWYVDGPETMGNGEQGAMTEPTAAYIAAADPTTVLALLDERDRLRTALEYIATTATTAPEWTREQDQRIAREALESP